jgi:hypothetical protein
MRVNLSNVAAPGNTRAVKHGAHSVRMLAPVVEETLATVEELCAGTPAAGNAFAAAREALAVKAARLRMVTDWLAEHGWMDRRGSIRPATRLELQLVQSFEASLDALGLTPTAAAKLGVDLGRVETLADELEKAREARESAEARHG